MSPPSFAYPNGVPRGLGHGVGHGSSSAFIPAIDPVTRDSTGNTDRTLRPPAENRNVNGNLSPTLNGADNPITIE